MVKVQNDICTCTHNIIIKFWPFIKTRSTLSHLKRSGKKIKNNVKKSKIFLHFSVAFFHTHNIICKQTNIPDFQLCYPWECLARFTCQWALLCYFIYLLIYYLFIYLFTYLLTYIFIYYLFILYCYPLLHSYTHIQKLSLNPLFNFLQKNYN